LYPNRGQKAVTSARALGRLGVPQRILSAVDTPEDGQGELAALPIVPRGAALFHVAKHLKLLHQFIFFFLTHPIAGSLPIQGIGTST
jgi:hypothetical protein